MKPNKQPTKSTTVCMPCIMLQPNYYNFGNCFPWIAGFKLAGRAVFEHFGKPEFKNDTIWDRQQRYGKDAYKLVNTRR